MFKKKQSLKRDIDSGRRPVISRSRIQTSEGIKTNKNLSPRVSSHEVSIGDKPSARVNYMHGVKKVFIIIILLFTVGIIGYNLSLSDEIKIEILGNSLRPNSKEYYHQVISDKFSKDLTSNTKFTINSASIEDSLVNGFPEIAASKVIIPIFGRKPTVIISLRKPVLRLVSASNGGILIDKNGIVISDLLEPKNDDSIINIIDESNVEYKTGKQELTKEMVSFVQDFIYQADDKNISISKIVIPKRLNGVDFYVTDSSYFIKTDISSDIRQQFGNYYSLKIYLEKKKINPKEYVDVRAEEKVYYK